MLTLVFFASGESGSTLSLYAPSFGHLLLGFLRKSGPWIHCHLPTNALGDIPLEPSSAVFEVISNAPIDVKPKGGRGSGICGAFDFTEEFLVKIPTLGPEKMVKSDQISLPWNSYTSSQNRITSLL